MHYSLTSEQRKTWQKNHFIILKDFLSAETKNFLPLWCDEMTAWDETPGKWMKYFEKNQRGERQLCRIENFIDYHSGMEQIATSDKTMQIIDTLMGGPAVIFKEKINYKFPQGGGFKPHQDAPAFISFDQKFHITMMVAIDECTLENGCLQVAINHQHKHEILPQELDGSIDSSIVKGFQWLPIECNRGDVILFDSYLPHFSEPNRSLKPRRAFFITYNKISEGGAMRKAYYQDKREKFPPDCERDPNKDYSAGAAIYNVANPISKSAE